MLSITFDCELGFLGMDFCNLFSNNFNFFRFYELSVRVAIPATTSFFTKKEYEKEKITKLYDMITHQSARKIVHNLNFRSGRWLVTHPMNCVEDGLINRFVLRELYRATRQLRELHFNRLSFRLLPLGCSTFKGCYFISFIK